MRLRGRCGGPSRARWAGANRGGVDRAWAGAGAQPPYVRSQMVDWGLPAGQPPYPRPSAQTPAPVAGARGTARDSGRGMRGNWSGARCRGGSAASRCRGVRGTKRGVPDGAPVEPAEGGGAEEGEGVGSGRASRTSRAGGCTICGATSWTGLPTPGRGGSSAAGSTDTQPETAVTATATRIFAVILVRCTRATLLCAEAVRGAGAAGLARTSDPARPRPPADGPHRTAPGPVAGVSGGPAVPWASDAGGAVDPFADEVGVAVVPGVLLDHVRVDPPEVVRLAPAAQPADISSRPTFAAFSRACAISARQVASASAQVSASVRWNSASGSSSVP